MCSIAERRGGGGFATAEGHGLFFRDLDGLRRHAHSPVRAVAERLLGGKPAGAPGVIARRDFHDIRLVADEVGFVFFHQKYSTEALQKSQSSKILRKILSGARRSLSPSSSQKFR